MIKHIVGWNFADEAEGRSKNDNIAEVKRRLDALPALMEGLLAFEVTAAQPELEASFDLHAAAGTRLGGIHLELTGEDVTECTGGARDLTDADLERAYRSTVDPRLNYEQALELAMLVVRKRGIVARG